MKALILSTFVLMFAAQEAAADQDVLLTISEAAAPEAKISLDLSGLEALPQLEFTTSTIWLEDKVTFRGPSLKALLDSVDVSGGTIEAIALNDYRVEIPVGSLSDKAPIVAILANGEVMSPRDKGPLWIVYPYDSDLKFQTEVTYSRSIWQLNRIVLSE